MELNTILIGVQGVLVKCLQQTGDFTRINYRGGNEKHISYITNELAKFLSDKHLLEDKKVLPKNIKELNEIVLFLALNTEFKKPLSGLQDFTHLFNVIPPLSKCLLANICFELNAIESYGYVIETFPLEATEELLDQVIDCLRNAKLEAHLHNAFVILRSVANKSSAVQLSYKTEDTLYDLIKVVTIILQNLTDITIDQAESMKASKIYQHMGFTLLQLFDLLLYVDESNKGLTSFIAPLLATTCSIIRCVTLNVFCSWSEINLEDQPLQTVIAGKAYLVIEKFQKHKPASQLVSMLGTIARKPKTIAERILEADVSAMVKMVDENNEYQKLWFRALINTPVFSDEKVVKCIERWWQLSDESTVDRLLSLPMRNPNKDGQIIMKCASNLSSTQLAKVLTIYFHREGFKWIEDIDDQLVLVFNQANEDISEEVSKKILLLVLQNARAFFRHFYATAFKRSSELNNIFNLLRNISEVERIGLELLKQVLDENIPSTRNLPNYIQLFDAMIKSEYYTWDFMVSNILLPLISQYKNDSSLEELRCCLEILKHFQNVSCELTKEIQLFEFFLTCAAEYRCKSFLEFEDTKEEITSCCVDFILHKCNDFRKIEGRQESFPTIGANNNDPWSNFYKSLFFSNTDVNFTDCVLPQFDMSNYDGNKEGVEHFSRLLKILPLCVPAEWKILLNEIAGTCENSVLLNAVSDMMILLCDLTENQIKNQSEKCKNILLALKFCLQNYGVFLVSVPKTTEDQILAINSLCRVLIRMPDILKPTEGMALINALPESTLKLLSGDHQFVNRIVLIKDKQLCKALAQKVLASAK